MTSTPSSTQPTGTNSELPVAGKDALLGSFVRRYAYVPVPVLGVQFRVRNLNELERSRYENALLNSKGRLRGDRLLQIKVRLIAITCVDQEGNLLYAEKDVPQLMQQDSQAIDQLVTGIKEHVGVSDDDLEDLEKNSGPTSGGDSR